MPEKHFHTVIDAPVEDVFSYRTAPGALQRLTPPWQKVFIKDYTGSPPENGTLTLAIKEKWLPFVTWKMAFEGYKENASYTQKQISGPFRKWQHTRLFSKEGSGCDVHDDIIYELPFGQIGSRINSREVEKNLTDIFNFRYQRMRMDIERQKIFSAPLHLGLSGVGGLIGSHLVPFLKTAGHRVTQLVREKTGEEQVHWQPDEMQITPGGLDGCNVVIHLAGENIAHKRWTSDQKDYLIKNRKNAATLISEHVASLKNKPEVLIVASAIGFYGNRPDEVVDENSTTGEGFAAELCRTIEEATKPAQDAGIRVVHLRMGVVLSPKGGALARMLLPFRLGGGGPVGNGHQYMSWIALEDVLGAITHIMMNKSLEGPVNLTAPHAVTNREFALTLGKILHRPALLPLPSFVVKTLFGQMGEELLLQGAKVKPEKLEQSGFRFLFPELASALGWEIYGSMPSLEKI